MSYPQELKDVICIGAYPDGKDFDMNYGHPGERPTADNNIAVVKLPSEGPLYGKSDPLLKIWQSPAEQPLNKP